MSWRKILKGRLKVNEPLKDKTSFRIGGRVSFFYEPGDLGDLKLFLSCAKTLKIPVLILGAGTNILVSDKPMRIAVIRLGSASFKRVSCRKFHIRSGSGVNLSRLLDYAKRVNLGGLEFLAGIPGTVGGALAMNAGAWGDSIGNYVAEAKVMDYNGKERVLRKSEIKFVYRESTLNKFVILEAAFSLRKRNRARIKADIRKYLVQRKDSQHAVLPNAGCVFKNPARYSAGRLIDSCGLKGRQIGGACVSSKHANFILNKNKAKCEDVLELMKLMRRSVKSKFGISLEPEIVIWR